MNRPYKNTSLISGCPHVETKMKRSFITAAMLTAAVLAFGPALAVDVINEDAEPYDLIVNDAGQEKQLTIESGATLSEVCVKCSLEMDTGDVIEADEGDVVVIKDGKFGKSSS